MKGAAGLLREARTVAVAHALLIQCAVDTFGAAQGALTPSEADILDGLNEGQRIIGRIIEKLECRVEAATPLEKKTYPGGAFKKSVSHTALQVGGAIRLARERRGEPVVDAARMLGVSTTYISGVESGLNPMWGPKAARIAEYYGINSSVVEAARRDYLRSRPYTAGNAPKPRTAVQTPKE